MTTKSVRIIPALVFKSVMFEKGSSNKLVTSNRTNEIKDITRKRMINCGKANLIVRWYRFFRKSRGGLTLYILRISIRQAMEAKITASKDVLVKVC
ncbi:hypothetical protein [Rothia nasimurium]|uniref:hypothetical protein n=1 Tax=Rothia nasimurium TaxID=85336 RepID=UPI003672D833